jgi:peptide/nickel transport system substrate-binding protein
MRSGSDNSDATPLRSGAWIAGWTNKDTTNRAIAAASEPDGAKRIAIYQQLERDLRASSPYAMMLQAKQIAVTRADVTGLTLGALSDRTSFARLAKT